MSFRFENIKLVVLDSDGVTVPIGTNIVEKETDSKYIVNVDTNKITNKTANLINKLKQYVPVAISSGRSLLYLQNMYSKITGGKNIIFQAENGNVTFIDRRIIISDLSETYYSGLAKIKEEIKKLSDKGHLEINGFEPKQTILTIHCPREYDEIYDIVKSIGKYKVMWNGEAFDIQSVSTSKGKGLELLAEELMIDISEVIAIGDKINDKEMVKTAGIGVSTNKTTLKADCYMSANELLTRLLDYFQTVEN